MQGQFKHFVLKENEIRIAPVLKFIFIFLFGWLVFVETGNAFYGYMTECFSFDRYQFLEVAREIAFSGIGQVSYLPNCVAAEDVIYWSHHFPPFLYAVGVKLFDIQIYDLVIVRYLELILLLGCVFVVMCQFMPRLYGFFLVCLISYEAVFNMMFIHKAYLRWSFIFGMLSFLSLVWMKKSKSKAKEMAFAFLIGFFSCMAPVSFVSLGVPILLGFILLFFVECYIQKQDKIFILKKTLFLLFGMLVPILIFGINILVHLDKTSIFDAYYTITHYYNDEVVNKFSTFRTFQRIVYYFSTIIVSPYGVNLLAVGIASTIINMIQWKHLNEHERFLVRATLVLTGIWIGSAMFIPTHFYSGRMIWMLPLYILQIIITIRLKNVNVVFYYILICLSIVLLLVQSVYLRLGSPGGAYGIVIAAFLAVVLFLSFSLCLWVYIKMRYKRLGPGGFTKIGYRMLFIILIGFIAPVFINYVHIFRNIILNKNTLFEREPVAKALSKKILFIAEKELGQGDTVLSNKPMKEFFPHGVKRQCIYFYRGLFGGATKEPADKVFLIGTSPGTNIADYRDVKVGKNIYYRGFIYHFEKRIELLSDLYLLIGSPLDFNDNEKVIYPTEYVSKDEVNRYLNWRVSNGLSVR